MSYGTESCHIVESDDDFYLHDAVVDVSPCTHIDGL